MEVPNAPIQKNNLLEHHEIGKLPTGEQLLNYFQNKL